jgi:hypothetical protein
MLKITSFSALIVGLLLATPLVFSNAEAGRVDAIGIAAKSDRQPVDDFLDARLAAAFKLVDVCATGVTGDAGSWCAARHAELADSLKAKTASNTVTIESRDEAAQTSTLAAVPADAQ